MQLSQQAESEDRYPKYPIQTASRLAGLKAGTLRAWERRYGIPSPYRTPNGRRLYAEYDLRLVRWLLAQTGAGLTIGRAVDFLHHLQSRGKDPIEPDLLARDQPSPGTPARGPVNQDGRS